MQYLQLVVCRIYFTTFFSEASPVCKLYGLAFDCMLTDCHAVASLYNQLRKTLTADASLDTMLSGNCKHCCIHQTLLVTSLLC